MGNIDSQVHARSQPPARHHRGQRVVAIRDVRGDPTGRGERLGGEHTLEL